MRPTILMVLTSHHTVDEKDGQTGFWWEELALPYQVFTGEGFSVELASIEGGHPPADPASLPENAVAPVAEAIESFQSNQVAMDALNTTQALEHVDPNRYEAIFLVGGHGAMWDFPQNHPMGNLLRALFERDCVISAVCHGPAGFVGVTHPSGVPLINGHEFTCFTNEEEHEVGMDETVPFFLEDQLKADGGIFKGGTSRTSKVIVSDRIVTGQNPESARDTAKTVVETVRSSQEEAFAAHSAKPSTRETPDHPQ